jgi:hypothetical protein
VGFAASAGSGRPRIWPIVVGVVCGALLALFILALFLVAAKRKRDRELQACTLSAPCAIPCVRSLCCESNNLALRPGVFLMYNAVSLYAQAKSRANHLGTFHGSYGGGAPTGAPVGAYVGGSPGKGKVQALPAPALQFCTFMIGSRLVVTWCVRQHACKNSSLLAPPHSQGARMTCWGGCRLIRRCGP